MVADFHFEGTGKSLSIPHPINDHHGWKHENAAGLQNNKLYPNSKAKYQYREKYLTMAEQKSKYHQDFRQYSPPNRAVQPKKTVNVQRSQICSRSSSKSRRDSLSSKSYSDNLMLLLSRPIADEWTDDPSAASTARFDFDTHLRMKMRSSPSPCDDNEVGRYRFKALDLLDFTYKPSVQTRHEVNLIVGFPFHLQIGEKLAGRIRFDGNARSKEKGHARVSYYVQYEQDLSNLEKFEGGAQRNQDDHVEGSSTDNFYLNATTSVKEITSQTRNVLPSWFKARKSPKSRSPLLTTQRRGRSLTRSTRPKSFSSGTTRSPRRKSNYHFSSPSKNPGFQQIYSTPIRTDDTVESYSTGSLEKSHPRKIKSGSPRVSSMGRTPRSNRPGGRKAPTIPQPFNLSSRGRSLPRLSPDSHSVNSYSLKSTRSCGRKFSTIPRPSGGLTPNGRIISSPKTFKARPLPDFYGRGLSHPSSPMVRDHKNEHLKIDQIVESLHNSFETMNETAKEANENFDTKMKTFNQNLTIIRDEVVQMAKTQSKVSQSKNDSNQETTNTMIDAVNNHLITLQNDVVGVKDLLEIQNKQRRMEMMILCSNCGSFIYYNKTGSKKYSCDLVKVALQWFALGHGCNVRADYTTKLLRKDQRGNLVQSKAGRKDFLAKLSTQIKDIIGHMPRLVKKEDGSHDIFFS